MRPNGLVVALVATVLMPAGIANAQCDAAGECFCDSQGKVGIAELVRAVNIALGQTGCPASPSPCVCCACDFGGGDVECGDGDTDCAECMNLGGAPAPECSICGTACSAGQTLCMDNPQHCQMAPSPTCNCCACDFGGGDIECGRGDVDCAECENLGGAPAAVCSICDSACSAGQTLCMNNPQQCRTSSGSRAEEVPRQSKVTHYSRVPSASRPRQSAYSR
jgi:hypothetical protein